MAVGLPGAEAAGRGPVVRISRTSRVHRGFKYLTPAVRRLCSQLHTAPGSYLTIKVGAPLCFVCLFFLSDSPHYKLRL